MNSTMSSRERPRISYIALTALGDKLNPLSPKDWRLFAAYLDPQKFTDQWIQNTVYNCQRPSFSATAEVLREWQQGLSMDQDVPVIVLIDTLGSLRVGRQDVASLIVEMMTDNTFLDPEVPTRNGGGHSGSFLHSHLTSRQFETTSTHRPSTPSNPGPQSGQLPQNFTKSKLSLNTDRSDFQSNPNPHCLKSSDHESNSKTWPQRGLGKTRQLNSHSGMVSQLAAVGPYIEPLRSGMDLLADGASPIPVLGPGQSTVSFYLLTYAKKSYKRTFELGTALKKQGQEVFADKMDLSSEQQRQATIAELYRKAKHIVIVYDDNYREEVYQVKSESTLNTRFIFDLMDKEFSQCGNNARFVPVIDYKRIGHQNIPPMFRDTPRQPLAFVFKALQDNNTARNQPTSTRGREVSIERVVYASH